MNFKEELARKADNLPMENMQIENEPQENGIYGNALVKGTFIRSLRANEIECRIAAINEKGLSLLLYKDARVDQRILDETFGWKRSHQSIEGNLYCTVEVYNRECGEWIAKQGIVSNEPPKGRLEVFSDCACQKAPP